MPNLVSDPGQAGALAVVAASMAASPQALDNATLAASQQGTWLRGTNSSLDGSQAQVQILCRPVPVRRADLGNSNAVQQQSSECRGCQNDMASYAALFNACIQGFIWGMAFSHVRLIKQLRSRGN